MTLHIERNRIYSLKEIEVGLGVVKVLTLRHWFAGRSTTAGETNSANQMQKGEHHEPNRKRTE